MMCLPKWKATPCVCCRTNHIRRAGAKYCKECGRFVTAAKVELTRKRHAALKKLERKHKAEIDKLKAQLPPQVRVDKDGTIHFEEWLDDIDAYEKDKRKQGHILNTV